MKIFPAFQTLMDSVPSKEYLDTAYADLTAP